MVVDLKKAIYVTHNVIKDGSILETIRERTTRIIDATIKNTNISGIVEVSGKAKVFLHKGKYATINNDLKIVSIDRHDFDFHHHDKEQEESFYRTDPLFLYKITDSMII